MKIEWNASYVKARRRDTHESHGLEDHNYIPDRSLDKEGHNHHVLEWTLSETIGLCLGVQN